MGASTGTSSNATNTRDYFQAWADNVAQRNVGRRSGGLELLNAAFTTTLAELHFVQLEPVMPFDPMFVDGGRPSPCSRHVD